MSKVGQYRSEERKKHYDTLMKTSAKGAADKVNHMIRNPTTYHINHVSVVICLSCLSFFLLLFIFATSGMLIFFLYFFIFLIQMIKNGMDHRHMWEGQSWTNMDSYGHHVGPSGHHGAPKVSSAHWSRPYQPAN